MQNKKSYIFISAHYGNWEITRNFLLDYGFELHTVYRHANNKLIDKEIQKIRKKPNAHFYKKGKESAKNMIKALKNNWISSAGPEVKEFENKFKKLTSDKDNFFSHHRLSYTACITK